MPQVTDQVKKVEAPKPAPPVRKRLSLNSPEPKLNVPEIPGYHCHWFLDEGARITLALQAGYQFVQPSETTVRGFGLADGEVSGSTDLGNRVSIVGGSTANGEEQRLYLMKIDKAYHEEDQALLAARNENIAAALRGGSLTPNENGYIPSHVKGKMTNLFTPKG